VALTAAIWGASWDESILAFHPESNLGAILAPKIRIAALLGHLGDWGLRFWLDVIVVLATPELGTDQTNCTCKN
jgi:hypothetical protein